MWHLITQPLEIIDHLFSPNLQRWHFNSSRTAFSNIMIQQSVSESVNSENCTCPTYPLICPRPLSRGCISAAGGDRWRSSSSRHFGHGRPSGIHSHAGSIHEMRRGVHHLLQRHGQALLSGGQRIQEANWARSADPVCALGADRKQVGSAAPENGDDRGGPVTGLRVRMSLLWDERMSPALHWWCVLHVGQGDQEEGEQEGECVVCCPWCEN